MLLCSKFKLLLVIECVQGAGGIRAAEGSSRGSRREATGSLGWNTFTMGIRLHVRFSDVDDAASDDDEVDGQVETAAATAASGAVCIGANGLKRCLNVCTSCCRGRNMPRGEPMQMRHCG